MLEGSSRGLQQDFMRDGGSWLSKGSAIVKLKLDYRKIKDDRNETE